MVLLLGEEDMPTKKTSNLSIRTKLTHLKIILSFTLKISIATMRGNVLKMNKWSYCWTRKTLTTKQLTLVLTAVTGHT